MRGKIALAAMAVSALAGCDTPITACEDAIKRDLRSPSTYDRIDASSYRSSDMVSLVIEYDAANAFGTPIRKTAYCDVPLDISGEPALSAARISLQT